MQPGVINANEQPCDPMKRRAKTPPYTGYGSWDDSMGSVTHLIPKLPKKDRYSGNAKGRVASSCYC